MRIGISRIIAIIVENFFIRSDYGDAKVTIKWKISFEKAWRHGGMGSASEAL
jgi:hypothetical protein